MIARTCRIDGNQRYSWIKNQLAYLVMVAHREERRAFGGGTRVLVAVVAEILLAALIAPSMMIFQSTAVAEILVGRDGGWQVQRRSNGGLTRDEICRKFTVPTLCGIVMAVSAFAISAPLLLWMSPVIIGLALAIPSESLPRRQRE